MSAAVSLAREQSSSSSSTKRRARIVSKSEVLVLCRPCSRRHRTISVGVTVERGCIQMHSVQRKMALFKTNIDVIHDLKTVWVNDMIDDETGDIRNCFAVLTPENEYILQSANHRTKIEWMQAISVAVSQSLKFRGSYRPSNWSKLDDLRKWLSVREVEFHYRTHPLYKGAVYTGKWNLGMPHICGSMKWPNGDCYEGEFLFGKFHGTGTMLWLSHHNRRTYTGSWRDGSIQGYGEMTYTDHTVYTGWWSMERRCGHGRLDLPEGGGAYIGAWEGGKRNGYGIFNNVAKSERYLGMWRNDKRHGPGILAANNKFYYSGNYDNGEKKLFGGRSSESVNQDDKWSPIFQSASALLEQMVSISHSDGGQEMQPLKVEAAGSDTDSAVAMDFSDIGASPDMDVSCRTCHGSLRDEGECVVCRVEGFKSSDHPLGLLVNILTRCFNESYSGIGCHSSLLSHAVGELCSITTRLHHLVKLHCPTLISVDEDDLTGKPKSQLSLLLKSRKGFRRTSQKNSFGTDPSWLHPILLPSIFKTLFALYSEHHREDSKRLSEKMATLDTMSDERLCRAVGIPSLYQDYLQRNQDNDDSLLTTPLSDRCESAALILQRINQFSTPQNKLLCVQEANDELVNLLDELRDDQSTYDSRDPPLSPLDDPPHIDPQQGAEYPPHRQSVGRRRSVPTGLFSLVAVRSRLENLCSEIQFIQDFAGTYLLTGKNGFLLGKLQDCHFQLQELRLQEFESSQELLNRKRTITYVR
ncbi:alsin-like [Halichondria panicea]|uniref:alsin-like n=1 Tax=Halichondria panicea TaxID=6063 RepID=UPI00312B4DD4